MPVDANEAIVSIASVAQAPGQQDKSGEYALSITHERASTTAARSF